MTKDTILSAEGLRKEFVGGGHRVTVLDQVSFALAVGETCAILGPSGSGKTTLLSLCAGLDTPSGGSVQLCGEALAQLDEDRRARLRRDHIGFVFQAFQLIPTLTALENVNIPLELRGEDSSAGRAEDLLRRVGLGDRLHHYPAQLSGGEQQRVAIARAFVHQPPLLFADEPTGNLDSVTAHTVIDLLFELNRARQATLLLVTHDPDVAGRCARTIHLRGGRIESDQCRT